VWFQGKGLRTIAKLYVINERRIMDTLAPDYVAKLRSETAKSIDWTSSLKILAEYFPHKAESLAWKRSGNYQVDRADQRRPTFRVTCARADERIGEASRHNFKSPDAAVQFGLGIADVTGWRTDLKDPDIDVLLHIASDDVMFGIQLTQEALHRRNVVALGRTPLIGTICYSLAYLANIQPGDVVVDPMCGGLSVPLEGALNWPAAYFLGGEMHEQGVQNSDTNLRSVNKGHGKTISVDILRWDVTRLPLRSASVDVILCDLPFGKKVGSPLQNQVLYPKALHEMARVTRKETGRAVLLTADKGGLKTASLVFLSFYLCAFFSPGKILKFRLCKETRHGRKQSWCTSTRVEFG